MTTIKVGDTLYRRALSFKAEWESVRIVGETDYSWIYEPFPAGHRGANRIDKKTLLTAMDWDGERDHYYTAEGRAAYDFCGQIAAVLGEELKR